MIMVRVEPKPVLDIDRDLRLCYGKTLDLTALYNTSGLSAIWYYGSQPVPDPTAVNTPGTYQLMAANGAGCADTAKVQLTLQPAITAYAGPDDTADFYTPYRLQGSGGGSYLWTPGSPLLNNATVSNPVALLTETTQFVLEVRDPIGCNDLDTVVIYVRLSDDFYVPNAFTPNGDGLNDYFSPVPLGGIASLDYFAVYNRFGNLVFQTSDITRRWDGAYAGRPQDPGNYVWVLKGKNRRGEMKFLKGNVILIR
jgi:gliding motility-associated-like protein